MPSFERGAALLRDETGELVRLSWEGEGGERRRSLPAGRYALVGYRLIARDGARRTWHVSASVVRDVELDLAADRENALAIEPEIRIETRFRPGGVEVSVRGAGGSGLTIYREGKRIPLGYRRFDATGAARGEGKITYG